MNQKQEERKQKKNLQKFEHENWRRKKITNVFAKLRFENSNML